MERLFMRFFFAMMRPVFDPIFGPGELPRLTNFYPDESWYKEQKRILAMSHEQHRLDSTSYPAAFIFRMICWEVKPAKFIASLTILLLLLIACKPLMDFDLFFGLSATSLVALFIACCYAFNNYSFIVAYFITEFRNRRVIQQSWQSAIDYQSFIINYNRKRYFKLPEWILTSIVLLLMLLFFAVLISALILAW